MLQNAIAAAAVALVASAIYAATRKRARPRDAAGAACDGAIGPQPEGEELVAVIAAAIAAATGAAEDSFRVVGIAPSRACARGGLNTPAWGHVDRFELGE